MLFLERKGWNIAQNFKVFSTIIAERVSEKSSSTRQQFILPIQTKPNTQVALLVANPITKFYAACREDKIAPEVALQILKANNKFAPFPAFPSFHFFPQSRYLLNHDQPIYGWRAPDHIKDFWEEMGFAGPPNIYNKSQESSVQELEIRKIYQQDFDLWEQITSPKKLIVPSESLKQELHYFCQTPTVKEEMLDSKMLARFGHAAHRFARAGFAVTPPEALATREETCRACPEWNAKALNGTGRCQKCGCSTWAKLRMATEKCPLDKWGPVNTSTPELQQPSTD